MTDDQFLEKLRRGYAATDAAGQSATSMGIFLQLKIYDELRAIHSLLATNEPQIEADEPEEEDEAA